jgi:hypothetical protein
VKRRLGVIVTTLTILLLGASGAQAIGNTTTAHWGCVGVKAIDQGVCVSNPLPERLPLPE